MRIFSISILSAIISCSGYAQNFEEYDGYNFVQPSICVVNDAYGVYTRADQRGTFAWENHEESYFFQVHPCNSLPSDVPKDAKRICSTVAVNSNRSVGVLSTPKGSPVTYRMVNAVVFSNYDSRISISYTGRLSYQQNSRTASKQPALFRFSSQCYPTNSR